MHNATGQMITTFVTFFIVLIPFVVLNVIMAKMKGKDPLKFGLLSLIPFISYILTIYLISLPDFELKKKVDAIYSSLPNLETDLKQK